MPRYFAKILVLGFAVGAALTCNVPFAAMATEGTVAPEYNTRNTGPAKPSRQIYLFLPDATIRASQNPFSRYQRKQPSVADSKETASSALPPTPALFLNQETLPTTSLMIGWLPAKEDMSTTGLYQPGLRQYVSTKPEAGCRTVDRTVSNGVQTPDVGSKGLHLPAGWVVGMCLRY